MTGDEIVQQARAWLGTPFHHQGRLQGVGVDCIGLGKGVADAIGVQLTDILNYPRTDNGSILERELDAQFDVVAQADIEPGDILLTHPSPQHRHIVIVTGLDPLYIIHCHLKHGVVEQRYDHRIAGRIVKAFRFRRDDGL